MLEKLEEVEKRYEELNSLIANPEVISDQNSFKKYMKEQSGLTEVVEKYREYKKTKQNMDEAQELMSDPEMKEMAELEYYDSKAKIEELEEELKILLLPKDVNDDNNVIIEIRGGAGGEEAALFAHALYRMYSMYADLNRWQVEVLDINETELGGLIEISFSIKGKGA